MIFIKKNKKLEQMTVRNLLRTSLYTNTCLSIQNSYTSNFAFGINCDSCRMSEICWLLGTGHVWNKTIWSNEKYIVKLLLCYGTWLAYGLFICSETFFSLLIKLALKNTYKHSWLNCYEILSYIVHYIKQLQSSKRYYQSICAWKFIVYEW